MIVGIIFIIGSGLAMPLMTLVFGQIIDSFGSSSDSPQVIHSIAKTFALDKCTGKKCYLIGAKQLWIVWGDTPTYWNWRALPESRFSEVAELLNVCWLEFPPAEVSVKLAAAGSSGGNSGEEEVKAVYLNPIGRQRRQFGVYRRIGLFSRSLRFGHAMRPQEPVVDTADQQPQQDRQIPKERGDGWMEIELGEFFNEKGENGDVEMSLMEVKGGNWKGGLIIQGIRIELRLKKAKGKLVIHMGLFH
ncbi:hypothetical protein NE237_015895 [Protea cynaroides]|uniref:Uncharacterized protein n=1 Tax=Protea cynaroides TaxID=273540 RepID=A0A9Q0QRN0_9MAGN|nr:hypothetical protein NE237_015895 [Protea cynaroides]